MAARGLIRLNRPNNKNSFKQPHPALENKDHRNFAIDANDFPSLAGVSDERERHDKNPLHSNRLSLSYSDKLKTIRDDSNVKSENSSENESRSKHISIKELASKRKTEYLRKGKSHVENFDFLKCDNSDRTSNQELSPEKLKNKSTDSSINKSNFENKSIAAKSHSFINQTNKLIPNKHFASTNNRTSFTIPSKCNNPDTGTLESSKTASTNVRHVSAKNEWISKSGTKAQFSKQSGKVIDGKNYPQISNKMKSLPSNPSTHVHKEQFHSRANTRIEDNNQNISTNKPQSNKSQIVNNILEKNNHGMQNSNVTTKSEQADMQVALGKKKKKRKSKIKRQAVLQSTKISVLTPEAHSKILNQSNISNTQVRKNIVTDINNSEEYPELGTTVVLKSNKENPLNIPDINMKKEVPASSDQNESNIVQTDDEFKTFRNNSSNVEIMEDLCEKSNEKGNFEPISKEKSSAHKKSPSTITLFDMLLSAKSRKKDPEKKIEAFSEKSASKLLKNSSKISSKKSVTQFVNPLDSSRPAIKRGKEREKPKIKRPSRMRKLILLGRQLKKEELAKNMENKKDNTEYAAHSDDNLSSLRLLEFGKDAYFIELCSGDKLSLSNNENEEIANMSSADSIDWNSIHLLNETCQDISSRQTTFTSRCSHNDQENEQTYNYNLVTKSSILKEDDTSLNLFNLNDPKNCQDLKDLKLIGNSDEISAHTVSSKPSNSNELAAKFVGKTVLHYGDSAQDSFSKEGNNETLVDEVKSVLENILISISDENKSSLSFNIEKKSCKNTPSGNECTLKSHSSGLLLPNLKNSETDVSNIKTEFHSLSEEGANNKEIHKCDNGLCNVTKDPGAKSSNYFKEENLCDSFLISLSSPLKSEINSPVDISIHDTNVSTVAKSFNHLEENENTVSDSIKCDISSNKNIIKESNIQLLSGEIVTDMKNSFKNIENDNFRNIFSDQEKMEAVKILIHSRKFRQYCNHFISKEMDKVVFALIDDLARFQDRMHQKDPVKAHMRRRLIYGIKEIARHMKLKKLKCIIIATDIENIKTEGGLNDAIKDILSLAESYHIPYIFSHRRFNLGKVCRKAVPVSCVGVLNYEGSEKNFKRIIELQQESKEDYMKVTKALMLILTDNQINEIFKHNRGLPEKISEFRTQIMEEHFYFSIVKIKLKNAPELPAFIESENLTTAEDSENFEAEADLDNSNEQLLNRKLDLSTKAELQSSKNLNKEEVFNILKKHNFI